MGFTVVQGSPQSIWCPLSEGAGSLYVGEIVRKENCGVASLAIPTGIGDLNHRATTLGVVGTSSGTNTPFGVVIGTNRKTPLFSSTYNAEYVTFAQPYSITDNETYTGVEGVWAKGDMQAMVKVALIDHTTVLRGNLYQSTSVIGTAPTVGTVTADCCGHALTTATVGVTGVDSLSSIYLRTGVNAGSYRMTMAASATSHTLGIGLNSTGTSAHVGDTLVKVNLPVVGKGRLMTSGNTTKTVPSMWVVSGAAVTTNYWLVDVLRLDLSVAGSEYVEFRFDGSAMNTFNQLCC
ncbi:MAG: hypothetical protein ACYS1A_18870 [Planctomycetota bacterium]